MALAEPPVDGNLVAAYEIALTPCWASDAQWLQRFPEPLLLVVPAAQSLGIEGPVALWEGAQPLGTVICEHVFDSSTGPGAALLKLWMDSSEAELALVWSTASTHQEEVFATTMQVAIDGADRHRLAPGPNIPQTSREAVTGHGFPGPGRPRSGQPLP
jgi:hypothetical protein